MNAQQELASYREIANHVGMFLDTIDAKAVRFALKNDLNVSQVKESWRAIVKDQFSNIYTDS